MDGVRRVYINRPDCWIYDQHRNAEYAEAHDKLRVTKDEGSKRRDWYADQGSSDQDQHNQWGTNQGIKSM